MSFHSTDAPPRVKPRKEPVISDYVTVALHANSKCKGGHQFPVTLTIALSQSVADKLGWEHDNRVHIFEGKNEDFGVLLIKPRAAEDTKARRRPLIVKSETSRVTSIRVHHLAEWSTRISQESHKRDRVPFQIEEDGQLKLVLPHWAIARECQAA